MMCVGGLDTVHGLWDGDELRLKGRRVYNADSSGGRGGRRRGRWGGDIGRGGGGGCSWYGEVLGRSDGCDWCVVLDVCGWLWWHDTHE